MAYSQAHTHARTLWFLLLAIFFMASPYAADADIIFLPCGFFLSIFFYSSPNLSGRKLDVYHTSTMCGSMVDIQSATAENRRGKKKKKPQDKNIMACPIP